MALDLYQRLGLKRGASEAEIKKAYRSLAKQLHPDRNKDNPKAAERFGEITSAYDLLSDKDKRARYDRGEIDEDGNPKMPFGGGFGGRPGGGGSGAGAGFEGFPGGGFQGGAETADLSDLFEGIFGNQGRSGGFGGFRQRRAPPQKGGDIGYRLAVSFVDAAKLAPQRITLADGKTIDLKLPAGVEDGTRIRLAGKGQEGPAGRGDGIVTIAIFPHPFYKRDGNDIRLELPVTLKEAVLGGKIKVPTPDGPVMLTVPKGSSSGKVLRLKGRGFAAKNGARGDQLVELRIDLPADDSELRAFAEQWSGGGNPRASMGV
ncbi:DnaJ domain-containing protein [Sphingomonas sinipercae]|uniref:DnaJ domain-containing protein n=1 Tax=Sphingomonas sinipercae TaxID=2714944 RepID=A0A6G7ZM06_9SPHN|nr:DnaJ C-terminal domain-containing protein [Sphingomonas sinipercae]QIL01950.1 DnaJ domain-containing protein [Sphingomonas sinipercae]